MGWKHDRQARDNDKRKNIPEIFLLIMRDQYQKYSNNYLDVDTI